VFSWNGGHWHAGNLIHRSIPLGLRRPDSDELLIAHSRSAADPSEMSLLSLHTGASSHEENGIRAKQMLTHLGVLFMVTFYGEATGRSK
jgi:hypothetical protein